VQPYRETCRSIAGLRKTAYAFARDTLATVDGDQSRLSADSVNEPLATARASSSLKRSIPVIAGQSIFL